MSFFAVASASRQQPLLQTCQVCAKRFASKARSKRRPMLEVELTSNVPTLGRSGTRVSVAPGHMRNHLYPKRLALYVLQGKTLGLDGRVKEARFPNIPSTSTNDAATGVVQALQESRQELDERTLIEQLSLLGPLRFGRRTTGKDLLHGSVTSQDLLKALQERGIQIQELEGSFQGKGGNKGIEQGRIKSLGEYIFNMKLSKTRMPIIVHVVNEES